MPFNLNAELHDRLPESLMQAQRAMSYADGLFETIRVFEGRMPLLEQHWRRISSGLQLLGFELPQHWQVEFFRQEILKISPPNARIRLHIWRAPGGLYLPDNNSPRFLISAQALESKRFSWAEPGIAVGISNSVRLPVDHFSNLKTLNAARYVAAAREASTAGWGDALLLNAYGRVCEATSSNVFWWEGETLCTVPLSEGCVAGVMRAVVLEHASHARIPVEEKSVDSAAPAGADEIFLTNAVRGIVPVRRFEHRDLGSLRTKDLFDAVVQNLIRLSGS